MYQPIDQRKDKYRLLKFIGLLLFAASFGLENVHGQCVAVIGSNFPSGQSIEGCEILTVQFYDQSSGVTSRVWDFGDGTTSIAQNPNHSFNAGMYGDTTYQVTLTITCASGTDTETRQVTVFAKPAIDFTSDKSSVCAITDSVCFNVDQAFDGSSSYTWNFGDGTISNKYEPCKSYSTPGVYDVELTIINGNGCLNSEVVNDIITVEPVPSTAFSVSVYSGCSPLTIEFENITDTVGNEYTNWTWDYGDGSEIVLNFDSPSHTYSKPGEYTVTLGTTNILGCYNYSTQKITVLPTPVADFTFTDNVCENDTARVFFTGMYDSNPSFNWNFDTASYIDGSGMGPYKVKWNTAGIKVVSVSVEENGCVANSVKKIQVSPLAEVYLSISADHDSVCDGESVTFSASPPYFSNYKYIVNSIPVQNSSNNEFTTSTLNNNDRIYVEISDVNGCSRIISDTVTVSVLNRPVISMLSSAINDTICQGQSVSFTVNPVGLDEYVFTLNNEEVQNDGSNIFTTDLLEDKDRVQVIATLGGCSSEENNGIITTVREPLPAPQVNCGQSTLSSIEYTWDEIDGAIGFQISLDGGAWQNPSSGTSGTSHLLTGLAADETHYIQVKATDGSVCGEGLVSEQITCTSIECDEISFYIADPVRMVCEDQYLALTVDSITVANYLIEWKDNPLLNKDIFWQNATKDTTVKVTVMNLDQVTCPAATKYYTLKVTERVDLSITHDASGFPVCEGEPIEFTVSPITLENYTFFKDNALIQSGTKNKIIIEPEPGDYEIYAMAVKQGCYSFTDTLDISIAQSIPIPVVNTLGSDIRSVLFGWESVPGATGYLVSVNHGPFVIPSTGSTGLQHIVDNLHPGEAVTLSVIALSNGPCGMSDQSQPAIGYAEECASFDFSVDPYHELCKGDSIRLEVKDLSISNYRISWSNGPETTRRAIWAKPDYDSVVSVAIRNVDEPYCPRIIKYIDLTVNDKPGVLTLTSSDADNIICEGEEVEFLATPGGMDTYEFYFGENLLSGNYFNSYMTTELKDGAVIKARALNGSCAGEFSNSIITSVNETMIQPQANCGITTSSSITFTWDEVPDALTYEVSINDQNYKIPSSGSTGLSHFITGLTPGDSATINVIAYNDSPCGQSYPSITTTCYAMDCSIITFEIDPDTSVCKGETIELSVNNINVSNYSLKWKNESSTTNTTYQHLSLNDTIVKVELSDLDQFGCPSVKKYFNIDVIETDVITLLSNSYKDSICANEELIFTVSPATYDNYTFYNNGSIVQATPANKWIASGIGNSNLVKVEVINQGCISSSEEIHTEIVPVFPINLAASDDGVICSDEIITFTATAGFSSYIFNDGLSILSLTSENQTDIAVRSEEVTVFAYNYFNCLSVSADTVHFTPLPLPSATIYSSRDTICFGEYTSFLASPPGMPEYIFYNNGVEILQSSPSDLYTSDSVRFEDRISVRVVDNNGCKSPNTYSPLPILIPYPQSTIVQEDPGICLYDETRLWIEKDELFPLSINYYWSTGENTDTITVSPENDVTYYLIYSDNKCTNVRLDAATVEVDRAAPPVAYAGIDTSVCIYDSVMLEGSGGLYLMWSPDSTLSDASSATPWASPLVTTNYVLTVMNQYCTSTDTVEVYVDLCLNDLVYEIPQIITPNGDGANDFWTIEYVDYFTDNHLIIFNRWNNIVYEASPYLNDWNGVSMKGDPLPEGTYFFILDLGNGTPPHKGFVIIHR